MSTSADSSQNDQTPLAHNHKKCVSHALEIAERLCIDRGVQLTPIRHQVLGLIWESHKAVKAYELLDRIKPMQAAAKPATIYRALDFLIEQGLIHRVESLNAFIGCSCSEYQHEQLLLICNKCLEVEERSATNVMSALTLEIQQAKFTAHSKALEIHGVCAKCRLLANNAN
jgi:Fur family transcriptional regulator, zinc uptake regulator